MDWELTRGNVLVWCMYCIINVTNLYRKILEESMFCDMFSEISHVVQLEGRQVVYDNTNFKLREMTTGQRRCIGQRIFIEGIQNCLLIGIMRQIVFGLKFSLSLYCLFQPRKWVQWQNGIGSKVQYLWVKLESYTFSQYTFLYSGLVWEYPSLK